MLYDVHVPHCWRHHSTLKLRGQLTFGGFATLKDTVTPSSRSYDWRSLTQGQRRQHGRLGDVVTKVGVCKRGRSCFLFSGFMKHGGRLPRDGLLWLPSCTCQ